MELSQSKLTFSVGIEIKKNVREWYIGDNWSILCDSLTFLVSKAEWNANEMRRADEDTENLF